jgi:hypothetical protein
MTVTLAAIGVGGQLKMNNKDSNMKHVSNAKQPFFVRTAHHLVSIVI